MCLGDDEPERNTALHPRTLGREGRRHVRQNKDRVAERGMWAALESIDVLDSRLVAALVERLERLVDEVAPRGVAITTDAQEPGEQAYPGWMVRGIAGDQDEQPRLRPSRAWTFHRVCVEASPASWGSYCEIL
jgi:hypothetical protein